MKLVKKVAIFCAVFVVYVGCGAMEPQQTIKQVYSQSHLDAIKEQSNHPTLAKSNSDTFLLKKSNPDSLLKYSFLARYRKKNDEQRAQFNKRVQQIVSKDKTVVSDVEID